MSGRDYFRAARGAVLERRVGLAAADARVCDCGAAIASDSRSGRCRKCARRAAAVAAGLVLRPEGKPCERYDPGPRELAAVARRLARAALLRRRAHAMGGGVRVLDREVWANCATRADGPDYRARDHAETWRGR